MKKIIALFLMICMLGMLLEAYPYMSTSAAIASLLLATTANFTNSYDRNTAAGFNDKIGAGLVDFEEAFDLIVKDNPNWLEHPQLQIEYYLDKDRKVKKRTTEQLQAILENEQNNEIKDYINYLLKPKKTETRAFPKRKSILDYKVDKKKLTSYNTLKK